MIRSMTAFARTEHALSEGSITWEIRSVNHRYLEQNFRLPERFKEIEPRLRDTLRKRLGRGKVEIGLSVETNTESQSSLQVNQLLLEQVLQAANTVNQAILTHQGPKIAKLSALELLQWPGVLTVAKADVAGLCEASIEQFNRLLDDFILAREREGEELKALILKRLEEMTGHVATVRASMGLILTNQKQKLRDKIADAQVQTDPERLEQEIVIIAQKIDVDEEMDRLATHIDEVKRVLNAGGAVGRRLDFLLQELNREANTLGSKSIDTSTTQAAVELKVLIEQIREQVQNIE